MIDLYNLDPSDGRLQVFVPRGATGTNDQQMWVKPRGVSQVMIFIVSPGGGGGGGFTGLTGSARGGGGGGGSGVITKVLYPAMVLPDVLYVHPEAGGAGAAANGIGSNGGNAYVAVRPGFSFPNIVAIALGGSGGNPGTATTSTGGSAGGASTPSNASFMAAGLFISSGGLSGAAGGSGAGANPGTAVTAFASQVITGGAGGASTPTGNTDAVGGAITAAGLLEANRAGGTTVGGAGQDGISSLSPFWSTGGAGGGSNGAGTGGKGGRGGWGSGGAGGGGGITGGGGGDGGDGLVIIACW